jgi:MoaA/NifB/PqqE/SkfB family radical SAM enzyme
MKKKVSLGTASSALFNQRIFTLFNDALRITVKQPAQAGFLLRTLKEQRKAAKVREQWSSKGIEVPPLMIMSITRQCNLRCKGCYAMAHRREPEVELEMDRVIKILSEASELGTRLVLIAGGEPLTRKDLLDVTAQYPGTIFPVFTNGLLLQEDTLKTLKKQKHVIPVLSLEGHGTHTDDRRGYGVYDALRGKMERLKRNRTFFGVSLTVTSGNYPVVTGETFTKELLAMGCRLFFYVEYVPVKEETHDLVLSHEQRIALQRLPESNQEKFPALFIGFPGDESPYGGCLAAGRGFVHVSPSGNLEPCPFAPFSDTNLKETSLKEALQSNFLKNIRENHHKLTESEGGCALWSNREWVRGLSAN